MWNNIISIIGEDLVRALSQMLVFDIIIAFISVLFTEAVKISHEKVFVKKGKPSPFFSWLVNIISIIIISIMVVLIFDGQGFILYTIFFIFVVAVTSWALATLLYILFIKFLFTGVKILYVRVKDYLIDSETELADSTIKLVKSKYLLKKELTIYGLENLKENE